MRRALLLVTDLEVGGTPSVVRELALRLPGDGLAVDVACLKGFGPVARDLADHDVRVTSLEARGVADLPRVVGRLRDLARDHGVVLSFLVHANVVAALARRRGQRLVQSVQTVQRRPAWHWAAQLAAARAADLVVAPSRAAADAAARRSLVPGERLAVIPNAVDATRFDDAARAARFVGGRVRVGFLGRLDPVKRVPALVEAVARLGAPFELHVFGDGPERARVARPGVTLHGVVAPERALAAVDVLALPSAGEGFGLVLIEAMAARVPVVAVDAGGAGEVVAHGRTGLLVPAGDAGLAGALAVAIARLARDGALRERLTRSARAEVEARFAWSATLPLWRAAIDPEPRQVAARAFASYDGA